jgi:inhibitor of cysteine peptidase
MKMMKYINRRQAYGAIAALILVVLALLLFPAIGFAEKISLAESSAQSTVNLTAGDDLVITLPGNPTTGYIWEKIKGGKKILQQQGDYQYTPSSSLMGAGGIFTFSFKALAQGSTKLRLIYHRPFEKNVKPSRTYELTVIVR